MLEGRRIELAIGRIVLLVLAIGCFVVLRPFLAALAWALILAMATWPVYAWFERAFGGRRTLAATLMVLLLMSALLLPLALLASTLTGNVTAFLGRLGSFFEAGIPRIPAPDWLMGLPIVGPRAAAYWQQLADGSLSLTDSLRGYLGPIKDWLLAKGAALGAGIGELALSLIAAFFFYRDGAEGVDRLMGVVERVAGKRGRKLLSVAEATMKGVVYGIIGTALIQGVLAGFGFWLTDLPGPVLLGLFVCFLSIIPMGPALVWLPGTVWLFYRGEIEWGIFLTLWSLLVVGTVDNFLKPLFISRGSDMPLLLVFLGVIGGAMTFGLLGVFIGPTLLAVGFALLQQWDRAGPENAAVSADPAARPAGGLESPDSPEHVREH